MHMHDGSWMLPVWGMMMFFWLGLIVLVVWLVLRFGRPHSFTGGDDLATARRILAERYARGELDHDEYDQRLRNLTRHQP
ncbi:MAG TPA: SHOCT domain-containing protein [Actinomycetales bacterium]|nr:SHOCT domain-containing protein [Actinomycetales bacterium]